MLELARKNEAKFIFVSSYVYGVPKYLPIDENHPLDSFNPYASSKIIGEELCRSFHRFFNLNTLIVRPFNIYGSGQNSNFLISSIFEQAKEGKVVLKDSRPKRDYIFIDDVIEALKKCVIEDITGLETINLGSGISYSVLEIVKIVNSFYSNSLQIHFTGEERPNEVLDTVADISSAFKILNWKPQVSLLEGIKEIINGK
jgi:UDP-glucose 4-epimerase